MPTLLPPPVLASGIGFTIENITLVGTVICVLLGLLSIGSWASMASKWRQLRLSREANQAFTRDLRRSPHPLSLFQSGDPVERSPMFHVYHAGCRELSFYLLGTDQVDSSFSRRLQGAGRITSSQMNAVRESMDRAVGEAALRLESRLGIVATALAGAPFLGLLGTVWGVMDSFSGIATSQDTSGMQALAPGLSAAMLTTVAGLIVAIPSMFGYNYLVSRVRDLIARLDHFAANFASVLDRHFVDHRTGAADALPSLGEMGAPGAGAFADPPGASAASSKEVQQPPAPFSA